MKPESFVQHSSFENISLTSHSTSTKKIDWTNTLFLTITPVLAVILSTIYFSQNSLFWPQIIMAVVFYFITGMSITAGYHRLFSHRTYEAHWLVKLTFLLFGAATFQNSALKWCSDHRIHHNHVDEEKDPYNINKGFFWAHIGWIFYREENLNPKYPKDLTKDPLIMWQHKHYFIIAVAMGLVLPTLLGHLLGSALGGLALSGITRIVFVHHCTFFINSLCHIVGTRPYTDSNTARDSWIMAIFSYGEGYHNYHHYFPTDYRNGIRWFQYDPTKWLIKSLSVLHLTKNLKQVPEKLISEAMLKMKNS